jgi:site-specific DNA-methyltransferase (adenine-specific)
MITDIATYLAAKSATPALPYPAPIPANLNTVLHGDCVEIMRTMRPGSVDLVITDPPYITRYRSRDGRTLANDDNARWLKEGIASVVI